MGRIEFNSIYFFHYIFVNLTRRWVGVGPPPSVPSARVSTFIVWRKSCTDNFIVEKAGRREKRGGEIEEKNWKKKWMQLCLFLLPIPSSLPLISPHIIIIPTKTKQTLVSMPYFTSLCLSLSTDASVTGTRPHPNHFCQDGRYLSLSLPSFETYIDN